MGLLIQILGGTLLFFIPGLFLLIVFRLEKHFGWLQTLCLGTGLSLAVVPLVLYVTTWTDLVTGPLFVKILLSLMTIFVGWQVYREWFILPSMSSAYTFENVAMMVALGVVALATLIARLWSAQDLSYPLWTDSYHHTLIAQLIVEQGQIPANYRPYAPIDHFTYHFGYHVVAAWYHWLTDVPIPRSVVITGQIINALSVPSIYLLTRYLFRSQTAGLAAALVVGLLSNMPAQYINWGRYTQLTGLTLLPVAMVLAMAALEKAFSLRILMVAALAAASLFFVHYRIFLFYLIWMVLYGLYLLWRDRRQTRGMLQLVLSGIMLVGLFGLMVLPWLFQLFAGFGSTMVQEVIDGYRPEQHGAYFATELPLLFEFGMHRWLLALAAGGAIWALYLRHIKALLVLIWIIGMVAMANLYRINITPLFPTNVVLISLYVPGSVLVGYTLWQAWEFGTEKLTRHKLIQRVAVAIATFLLMVLSIQGVIAANRLVAPQNGFITESDVQAVEWVRNNTPADVLFYIETSFWTPVVAHGVDAGYWLPLLADRQTIMPPQIYASDGEPEYIQFVNGRLSDLGAAAPGRALWQTLKHYQVTHIYLGGRVDAAVYERFAAYPDYFSLLYNTNHVWIFGVVPNEP
jgi:hypothetical protein